LTCDHATVKIADHVPLSPTMTRSVARCTDVLRTSHGQAAGDDLVATPRTAGPAVRAVRGRGASSFWPGSQRATGGMASSGRPESAVWVDGLGVGVEAGGVTREAPGPKSLISRLIGSSA
jgi:hypothetical protein